MRRGGVADAQLERAEVDGWYALLDTMRT